MRMLSDEKSKSALLIVGDRQGCIHVYQTPISHAQRITFTLQRNFQAHTDEICSLHFHHHKPLFVSGADEKAVKVWNFTDITNPRLIKSLPHPDIVSSAEYSESGLLLTACDDDILRVYGQEPLFSLYWSFKTSDHVYSVGWSPCNRICASFNAGVYNGMVVQVWDSSFQTIFKLKQNGVRYLNGLVFASNDLLLSSGGIANKIYWYHMSKPKVMKVFVEKDLLPFCRDVLKIIIKYLPFVTRVTYHKLPNYVGPVVCVYLCNDYLSHLCVHFLVYPMGCFGLVFGVFLFKFCTAKQFYFSITLLSGKVFLLKRCEYH